MDSEKSCTLVLVLVFACHVLAVYRNENISESSAWSSLTLEDEKSLFEEFHEEFSREYC